MTVSSLSPTFLSRSRPSSSCFCSVFASSRYRCISLSASSRPNIARFNAASLAFRSSALLCCASESNLATFLKTHRVQRKQNLTLRLLHVSVIFERRLYDLEISSCANGIRDSRLNSHNIFEQENLYLYLSDGSILELFRVEKKKRRWFIPSR